MTHPVLWYTSPASKWTDALPLGNGRLGAMVFGGTTQEELQLNEDTLWSGGPNTPSNPEALANLAAVRALIFEGRFAEAERLADAHLMGRPYLQSSYQPAGRLLTRPRTERAREEVVDVGVVLGRRLPVHVVGRAGDRHVLAVRHQRVQALGGRNERVERADDDEHR